MTRTKSPQVFRSGFTTVTDLDFGSRSGPQFFALPADLVRISPDGQRTVLGGHLNRPTSLVVDSSASVYYTNRGIHGRRR